MSPNTPKPDDGCDDDKRSGSKDDGEQEKTALKPVDRKVPEGPDNLNDRAAAFKRRHGTTE
jgi:hypothetical protein